MGDLLVWRAFREGGVSAGWGRICKGLRGEWAQQGTHKDSLAIPLLNDHMLGAWLSRRRGISRCSKPCLPMFVRVGVPCTKTASSVPCARLMPYQGTIHPRWPL